MSLCADRRVDLHVHTHFSDGTLSPSAVVSAAAIKKLHAIAITDHNTIDGIKSAAAQGIRKGVQVISGVEISTTYRNRDFHLLGLNVNCRDIVFTEQILSIAKQTHLTIPKIIHWLKKQGICIAMEDVIATLKKPYLSRINIALAMIKLGYTASIAEAFEKYLSNEKYQPVEGESIDLGKAIELINRNGGNSILAHPGLNIGFAGMSDADIHSCIRMLAIKGLLGLEIYHSAHTKKSRAFILGLCNQYGLYGSGGSDFHGSNKENVELGSGCGDNVLITADMVPWLSLF